MTLQDPQLPTPLAVVCADAGACNVILPWLDASVAQGQVRAYLQGPALALWQARFGPALLAATLDEALQGAALVLTGTGWSSSLEHDARLRAAALGLRCSAVIDHWVNYPERFIFNGQTLWPDEIWLTDELALAKASRHFPARALRIYANRYLQEQAAQIASMPPSGQGDVLLVMEPMRTDWGRGAAGEFQALEFFMQHRQALGIDDRTAIRLRPHPSDAPGKYASWLSHQTPVRLDTHVSLAAAMNPARWVVGCESYALVVALAAGRVAVSSLPPWAGGCRLPQQALIKLADLAVSV